MKILFAVILTVLFGASMSLAQNPKDSVVSIYNNWGLGDNAKYEILSAEYEISNGDTVCISANRQMVLLSLVDTLQNGDLIFRCNPSVKDRIVDKTGMAESYKSIVEKTDTIPIELQTDFYGSVKDIYNIDDVLDQLKSSGMVDAVLEVQLNKYKQEHPEATENDLAKMSQMLNSVRNMLVSKELVYKDMEPVLSLFELNGVVMVSGMEYKGNLKKSIIVAPNIQIDAEVTSKVEICSFDNSDLAALANVVVDTKYDEKQLISVAADLAEKAGANSQILENISVPVVTDRWYYWIELESGTRYMTKYYNECVMNGVVRQKVISVELQ